MNVDDTSRVLNKKHDAAIIGSVYVGRPSKWGNPFAIGVHGTRDEVIEKYALWIQHQPNLLASLSELRGKNLVCWCAPERCHADVLLKLANE